MKTTEAIDWLRPFHEAAEGKTSDALTLALASIDDAPEGVMRLAVREGLRVILHAFRRSSTIRVNGDALAMPLFVAIEEEGVVRHVARFLATVDETNRQVTVWGGRREQANRELTWWSHQRDLAVEAKAEPSETLRDLWLRLGVPFEMFIGAPADELSA